MSAPAPHLGFFSSRRGTLAVMNAAKSVPVERRRARRLRLKLRGRYLLPEGGEHPCESLDVSTTGVSLASPMIPDLGERIVVYLDELGRLEGVVVRRDQACFSLSLKSPANRMERLAQKLASLSGETAASCRADVLTATRRFALLQVDFGQPFEVEAREESDSSVRIFASFTLLPGARLAVDGRPGVVSHDTNGGFIVSFERRCAG